MARVDPWPFRHLALRTPRLELRPDDDAGLLELVEEVHLGIHPPDEGRVIGVQTIHATDFAITREVSTGSWIGRWG